MTQAAGKTGAGPMVSVAIEQYFPAPQRILDDDLAYSILPFGMRAFVCVMRLAHLRNWMVQGLEKPAPGIWGGMMCRKRYIDEKLAESVGQIDAVVNLGAGFDTRVYRIPGLSNVAVWEVDLPANIEAKRTRLAKLFRGVPENVRLVPSDFDHDDLSTSLAAHGYSPDKRTFFIWEAVTQYLNQFGIEETLNFLARAKSGSRLAFTYIRKDFIEGLEMYGQAELYKKYVIKQKIWLYGFAPASVPEIIGSYGWHVIEHPSYENLAKRYVKPTGRNLAATLIEQMIFAEKG